jgi:hypothetical protein
VVGFNSTTRGREGRLPETLEETSYTVEAVDLAEMLHAVGEELQRARLSRKLKPTDVERLGGPSYKTVQAIEEGEAGHIESLDKCARALDLSIIDVLYSVLSRRETPLSPEAALIVRRFNETTILGRQALLAMATALEPAPSTRGKRPTPGGGAGPKGPRR